MERSTASTLVKSKHDCFMGFFLTLTLGLGFTAAAESSVAEMSKDRGMASLDSTTTRCLRAWSQLPPLKPCSEEYQVPVAKNVGGRGRGEIGTGNQQPREGGHPAHQSWGRG